MEQEIAAVARAGAMGSPLNFIKENIKKLTHREMRSLVDEIFATRKKEDAIDGITKQELPDVLDRWAYGD